MPGQLSKNLVNKPIQVKQKSLNKWFQWLIQWVRQIFIKNDTTEKPLIILERTYSNDGLTLLLSVDRDAPGAVATWYFIHKNSPNHNLLITVDNLAAIRLALRKNRPKQGTLSNLELSLLQKDKVTRTHRFSVQWIIELQSSRKVFTLIGTWDADLQGNSFDANTSAITIFRFMVREALNLKPIPGVQWRARMVEYPWAESLEHYAHAVLGERHNCHIKKIDLKAMREIKHQTEGNRTDNKQYKQM